MNIFSFLNPIIVLSRLFGLTPVVPQPYKSVTGEKYELSKLWLSYSIIFVSIQVALEFTVVSDIRVKLQEAVLEKSFQFLTHGTFIFVFSVEVMGIYQAKKFVSSLNKLAPLTLLKVNSKHSTVTLKIVSYFIMCYIFILMALSFSMVERFTRITLNNDFLMWLSTLRFIVSILPYFQMIHVMFIIKHEFESLNSMIWPNLYRNFHKIDQDSIQANKSDKAGLFRKLSYLHQSFCDLAEEFNSIYSVQVTIILGLAFLQTTASLYVTTRSGSLSKTDHMTGAIQTGVLLFSAKVVALLWLCNGASAQVSLNCLA